jgi:hypothetical protein
MEKGTSSIIRQFGGSAGHSSVWFAPSGQIVDSLGMLRCNVTALAQKGWSLNVEVKLAYVRRSIDDDKYPHGIAVTFKPKRDFLHLDALSTFRPEEVTRLHGLSVLTGNYNKNLFYDTYNIVSFPYGDVINLADREVKNMRLRVSIPVDFPEELVNKKIEIEIGYSTQPPGIVCQNSKLRLIVIA